MVDANGYAKATGREAPELQKAAPVQAKRVLPPLTTAAQARIAGNRALVHEHLPEALPFIKELHELGLIDGWRSVEDVTVYPKPDAGTHP